MAKVTLDNITEVVCAALGKNGDITDRQREIMVSLVTHLHGFCKDVNLQHNEFIEGCEFLRRAGETCNESRQEFILLGDILGVEVLTDMLTNPAKGDVSESTVLGPFYRENPARAAEGRLDHPQALRQRGNRALSGRGQGTIRASPCPA